MTRISLRVFALLFALLMLTACAPKAPEEVTDVFWKAVISNDAEGAAKYSTLSDARDFDGFGKNWAGYTPSHGKIVIDGDKASVTTKLTKTTSSGDESVDFDTILVLQDQRWKVDYTRTGREVSGGPFAKLFGQLERVGDSLSSQFSTTSKELAKDMERMGDQLAKMSQSIGDQANQIIEQQGEEMRKSIKEFAESTRRALKELEDSLSDKDRKVLQEVSDDLDKQSDELASDPTIESIADGAKSIAIATEKVSAIDSKSIEPYKKQWREMSEKTKDELQSFVNKVSTETE